MSFRYRETGLVLVIICLFLGASAQDSLKTVKTVAVSKKKWYETFTIRGYVQTRYNRLLETNPKLKCDQCDRGWGGNGGFSFRRVRIIIQGNISEQVSIYIQPDFASSTSNGLNYGQIRDAYFDLAFDKRKTWRIRVGQSKVPYGFEALQSSSNRLPLDRSDGINSAIVNERDLGAFIYWAPVEKRELFNRLTEDGLKGSGDYGVVGVGIFNGQVANRPDQNRTVHVVGRLTWPVQLSNGQIIEGSIQAYSGNFTLSDTTKGVKLVNPEASYKDERVAASFILYPQPFGIQAEYNVGTGPQYDPTSNTVLQKKLQGGYIIANYMVKPGKMVLIPFARYHYYEGGKKFELDARSYKVNELEFGTEWQINRNVELVAMYVISNRRFEDATLRSNAQQGRILRLQAQLNF